MISVVVASAYIVLSNTVTSGHCRDNLAIIKEDISSVSLAIQNGAMTVEEFDKELSAINIGHHIDNNTIRLQIAVITFDMDGRFEKIDF